MAADATIVTIRFAARADAAAMARLSRELIERGLPWSWTRERVLRSLRHPDTNAVVAVRQGELAGFGIMKYDETEAHLLLLAVAPRHGRLGVGRALVAWLERSARVAGIGRVTVEARFSNVAARNFYGRLGFGQAELLPGYYDGREAAVRLAKVLSAG